MIRFRNVTKIYKVNKVEVRALDHISLTVKQGDIFGVIGFSGAGKSTLIRTVNLLESPTSGEIFVEKQNLQKLSKRKLRVAKKRIGMIFQHFNLLKSRTVFDNIALPLELSNVAKEEIKRRVMETLEFVGLVDRKDNYPDQLSGGQKQRVGIARALVTKPTILLCDEATSALDPQTTISILNLLKKINKQYNITILIITHEMDVIKEICNRVAVMENGRVIEVGEVVDIFANPQTETTLNFVQSVVKTDIPASIYRLLEQKAENIRIFQFKFLGENASNPLISQLAQTFAVEVNVLFGNITELQGVPFGNLIVELSGSAQAIEESIRYVKQHQVQVEEVKVDASRY